MDIAFSEFFPVFRAQRDLLPSLAPNSLAALAILSSVSLVISFFYSGSKGAQRVVDETNSSPNFMSVDFISYPAHYANVRPHKLFPDPVPALLLHLCRPSSSLSRLPVCTINVLTLKQQL